MRFSIRDLLLVTVIVALAVGWGVDHRAAAAYQKENKRLREAISVTRDSIEQVSGRVNYSGPVLIPDFEALK